MSLFIDYKCFGNQDQRRILSLLDLFSVKLLSINYHNYEFPVHVSKKNLNSVPKNLNSVPNTGEIKKTSI